MDPKDIERVERWIGAFKVSEQGLEELPSITDLWEAAQVYLREGRSDLAWQCELLIRMLHNSSVSIRTKLGAKVNFAYGGIGVVVHKDADIGDGVMIGQGVTIGGAPGVYRLDTGTGERVAYPKINNHVYLAAGVRIIGGVEIGAFSVIGTNAVVKKSLPPFSVCSGVPVRSFKTIVPAEFHRYKGYWALTKHMRDEDFIAYITAQYESLLRQASRARWGEPATPGVPAPVVSQAIVVAPVGIPEPSDVAAVREALADDAVVETVMASTLSVISQDFAAKEIFSLAAESAVVRLPFTDAEFTIPASGEIDWNPRFETHVATNVAFFLSLQWIGEWLCVFEARKKADYLARSIAATRSYLRYMEDPANSARVLDIRSTDHSISIRARVLVKLLHLSKGHEDVDREFQRRVLRHLLLLAEWLVEPANYRQSNHGVMCDIALLHVAVHLRHFTALARRYERHASDRILALARFSFDADGYCNENTVGYHRFNTSLYESVRAFCKTHGIEGDGIAELGQITDRARLALKHAVWQDGTIPPIGDSPVYHGVSESTNESKWFRESGFLVIKNDDLYVSLICGARGWVHKQCDDSSITIRYKNRNILVDAGHYTHDEKDPYRMALAGQRGHSGIYLKDADSELRAEFLQKFSPYEARITEFVEGPEVTTARCFYSVVRGAYRIERTVRIFAPDEILIEDDVTCRDGDAIEARQRFMFDPSATYGGANGQLLDEQSGAVLATFQHLSPSTLETYRGEPAPEARGWCSVKFGELLPTTGIDFVQEGACLRFATAIKLGASADLSQFSAPLRAVLAGALPTSAKPRGECLPAPR